MFTDVTENAKKNWHLVFEFADNKANTSHKNKCHS